MRLPGSILTSRRISAGYIVGPQAQRLDTHISIDTLPTRYLSDSELEARGILVVAWNK